MYVYKCTHALVVILPEGVSDNLEPERKCQSMCSDLVWVSLVLLGLLLWGYGVPSL